MIKNGKIKFQRKGRKTKRAVSPAIGVILLVGLAVIAGSAVYIVVSGIINNGSTSNLIPKFNSALDYNNDGKIDAILLDVENAGNQEANASFVNLDNWKIVPTYSKIIKPGEITSVLIITSDVASQQNSGSTISLGVSSDSTFQALRNIKLDTFTVPDPTTVEIVSSQSVSGVTIRFTHAKTGIDSSFPPTTLDSNNQVQAYLMPDYYIAKASNGLSSSTFHNVLTNYVSITTAGQVIKIKVVDSDNNPISGLNVSEQNTGKNSITDSNGESSFTLISGNYQFQVVYSSIVYYSSPISIPTSQTTYTIQVGGNTITGIALFGGEGVGNRKLFRLFDSNNNYQNKYDYSNSTSYFEFTNVQSGLYRLRLDYQNTYYWSSIFSSAETNLTVDFGGGKLTVLVTSGSNPLPNRVLTRLYHSDNKTTWRYDFLNSTGYAEYGLTPGGDYLLRIDWQNSYYYTPVFTHSDSALKTIDIGGSKLTVLVTAGGNPLPNRVLTRLFHSDNKTTWRYDYLNASGYAEYPTTPSGSYLLRIDWQNSYYYTPVFIHADTSVKTVDIGGGKLTVLVTASGEPLPNRVLTRLFRSDNRTTWRYDYLNASGYAEYPTTPTGSYLLRIDWQNSYYYTPVFVHADTSVKTVDIGGGKLTVLVTASGEPLPNRVLTRLFHSDNRTTWRYDYLNASGYAEYPTTPTGSYLLRIDWQNSYYYTPVFVHADTSVKTVDIGGGKLTVLVTAGGNPLPNRVLTRLFHSDNRTTWRYDYLNASGYAEYPTTPTGSYLLRIDWQNSYYYTPVFVHADTSVKTVDIGGSKLTVLVTANGEPLPNRVLTRLFRSDNRTTWRYDYLNASGYAEYPTTPAGSYLLRIDWQNSYYYTPVFVHADTSVKIVDIGGGKLTVLVTANGEPLPNRVLTRLYHSDNRTTWRYDYLNASGYAEYPTTPTGSYLLRIDWLNRYFYTSIIVHSDGSVKVVDLGGGSLNIKLTIDGADFPANTITRLYLDSGTYASRYDYVNSSSFAEYGAIPEGQYKIRVDYNGQIYYTNVFFHDGQSSYTLNIVTVPLQLNSQHNQFTDFQQQTLISYQTPIIKSDKFKTVILNSRKAVLGVI